MAQQVEIVANLLMKVDNAEAGINKLKSSLSKLKLPDGLDKNLAKSFANLDGIFERYRNQLNKGFKTKGDVSTFSKVGKELENELNKVSKHISDLTGKKIDFKVNSEPIRQAEKDLAKLIERQQELIKSALNFKIGGISGNNTIESLLKGIKKEAGDTKAGKAANAALANLQMGDVDGAKAKIDEIIVSYNKLGQAKKDAEVAGSGLNIVGAANTIKSQLDVATSGLQEVKNKADNATDSLNRMRGEQIGKAANEVNKMAKKMEQVAASTNQANKAAQEYAQSSLRMTEQLNQLKSSTQYFFGLRNMLNLLKQGFREALETVKELDAAMTETAVVTKFDVGDMWEKLPEYTANANALGATIKDMYKSATLYYQQGLDAQQAMGIASETMKMARIGGLEAADATDMMTAALRGFNMELSNVSAQRINDVYSNLAAKTASNTKELGEAMERTASIANSAGMSFEGTSAFLAQMIETTREAPENLGTAMKTIIARFQELKKNPLEMQEVDGEEVSFNRVDTALQTIGVSLKNANGQFRELDQVFLDIASRWDRLSQTQQRFIATTAAGSRQQSRFIAMMNNYDRTVQLMNYANDSAGASNEQFGKTMEGLEAKLNKLKNAWDLFRMGLASNDMIKGTVDGLTKIINTITKLIDTLSFGSGKLKSALTIFTAFTGLRMAGKGINALLGGIGGMLDPNSSILKGAFGGGLLGSRQTNAATQAKMINQPIVSVLNQILGAVRTGKTGAADAGTRANYKESLSNFRKSANKSDATISGTLGALKGLDSQQVRLISKSNVGTMRQLQRSMAQSDMGDVLAAQVVTAMKRGNISGNQVASLNKGNIGAILGTQQAESYSQEFVSGVKKQWRNTVADQVEKAIRQSGTFEEITQEQARDMRQAAEKAAKSGELASAPLMSEYIKNERDELVKNPLYNKDVAKRYKENIKAEQEANKQRAKIGDDILKKKTPLEIFQNGLSHIGGAAITAGQGLMSLGATLNSMGFEAAGAAVSSFGSALSNLGMIANGLPAMLSLLSNPIGAIATVVGVGVGAIVLSANATLKKIKEDAEAVTNSFKQIQEETTANISNLKTWKNEMATLSKGVDKNGLNVNLNDVDYAHYLEIVDAVAKMNPEIVKGYTAQGHAIIDNNTALDETLKKLQDIQHEATDTYLDSNALQKLINARNINKDFKNATTATVAGRRTRAEFGPATTSQIQTSPLTTDVKNLLSGLQKQKDLDIESILKTYNINLKELESGEQQAVNQFVKFQDKINSDVSKAVGTNLDDAITEGFSKLSDNTAAFEEAIQPVLQNLQTYATNLPGFEKIGSEFQTAINAGLKDIAIRPDLDASAMQKEAKLLVQEFDNLTRKGNDYATAMEQVEDAQNQFASSLDASEYAEKTKGALATLNSLLEQYKDNTTAYGQAVTEYLTNQIDKITKFTEKGTISLTEALNTATNEIAAAEGAYQAFQDATKSDLSTGADNMKSIFDEITKETDGVKLHMQGEGDNTLWTGMSSLFSEKAVEKAAEKGPEAVQKMLNRIKPMLQDGQKGFDAFWTDLFSDKNYAKLKDIEGVMMDQDKWEIKWDDDLNPDVFHEMAEALGYSDAFLTSMLNKGRQFSNLNFMDTSEVRKALSTDESTIRGTSTSTIINDEGKKETVTDIFVKGDYLKTALSDAGIANPAEQKEAIDNITKHGVKIIPDAKDISEDTLKRMGISDIPSLIKTFGDTGQFNRSEIEEYAQQMKGYESGEFDTLYGDYISSQEHPELPSLNNIDSNVDTIASILASNRVAEGYADESTIAAYEEAKKFVNGENGHGKGKADSISELFAQGKNKNGEPLTKDEFLTTQKLLDKQINTYSKLAEEAAAGAKKAEKDNRTKDAKELSKEAKGYAELVKRLESDKHKGEQNSEYLLKGDKMQGGASKAQADAVAKATKRDQDEANKKAQQSQAREAAQQAAREAALEKANAEGEKRRSAQRQAQLKAAEQAQKNEQTLKDAALQKEKQMSAATRKATEDALKHKAQSDLDAEKRKLAFEEANRTAVENSTKKKQQAEEAKALQAQKQESASQAARDAAVQKVREDADKRRNAQQVAQDKAVRRAFTDEEKRQNAQQIAQNNSVNKAIQQQRAADLERTRKKIKANEDAAKEYQKYNVFTTEDIINGKIGGGRNITTSRNKALELLGSTIKSAWDALDNIDASTPTQNTTFINKIQTSVQKLGETLKQGWDALNGINSPSSKAPQTTGAINKGSATVANIAQGAIQKTQSTFTVDTGDSDNKLQAIKKSGDEAYQATNRDSKFTITVPGEKKLANAADNAKTLSKSAGTQEIGVKTGKVEMGSVNSATSTIKNTQADIKVGADTGPAQTKVDNWLSKTGRRSTTVEVEAKVKKTGISSITVDGKTVNITAKASGMNNHRVYSSLPSFGSLAKGTQSRYGQLGPHNKGGLTLTGEEGYEIAWLPDENRSMILGAGGPQMLNLPSNAVVWTHKQSKKILKRQSVPAGSMSSGGGSYVPYTSAASNSTSNKVTKKSSQAIQKAAKTVETVSAKAGKVFVWWENMARSVEKAQRDAEQNQKTLERLLKNFGTTLSEYNKTGETYRKSLETQIDLANQRFKKAEDELHITDYGADSKKSNDYLAAIGARQEISYEITKTKKKKGKKKTTTETKKETLNLAKYITKTADGLYQLNQGEIDKVAKSNKSRAEAIKAAAEKQLNDLYSKLKSAEDDRIKAEEALEQFYNDAYEAFGRWDRSITAVYLLGQQLEKLSAEANIYESAVDLQTSKLEAGFAKAIDVLPQIISALERNRDIMIAQVQTNAAKVDAAWKEYNDSLSLRAITEKYLANQNSTDAAYDYDVMKNTLAFLQNAGLNQSNFNLDTAAKALEELYANQWKGDDYEKIKEGLDKIAEKQGDYYSTLADTYGSLNEVYQKIEEYQSYMADFEGTLIKGIEDQANKQIDKLNKLNSSLSTAAKDIIDEVKRKLDERRKQEDNAKTESEISQKQQRLAALRADTAGGHATEIAQLEKEIADSQQSYGRTLEDQLLDRLSQQQDNAEKQRERQIALLEAQRDFAAATGSNVDQINKWLQDPANYAEEIKSAFLANNNFEELGELERKQLLEEFESKFGTYLAYADVLPKLEEAASQDWPDSISKDVPNSLSEIENKLNSIIGLLGGEAQMTAETNSDAMTLKEFKDQGADAITARTLSTDQGSTYTAKDFIDAGYTPQETKAADFSAEDFYKSNVSYTDAKAAGFNKDELINAGYSQAAAHAVSDVTKGTAVSSTKSKTTAAKNKYLKYLQELGKTGTMNKSTFSMAASLASDAGLSARTYMQNLADIDKPKNITWAQVIKAAKANDFNKYRMALSFTSKAFQTGYDTVYGKGAYKKNHAYAVKNKYTAYKYASGGLASQTGPAWLDGTPSKPELVLNAQDTKNFIALKDVLARAIGSTSSINNSYAGDATYEININVDHLNNDYDVDKVVERVKKKIVQDSGYRNVTQVRKFR